MKKYTKNVNGVTVDMTPEEVEEYLAITSAHKAEKPLRLARQVRSERDRLLSETDWIVIKAYERNDNIPGEWEVYRQALRDITSQEGFPYSVTWPTKP